MPGMTMVLVSIPVPAKVAFLKAVLSTACVSAIRKFLFIVGQAFGSSQRASVPSPDGSTPLLKL
jgi:hypothetical protein